MLYFCPYELMDAWTEFRVGELICDLPVKNTQIYYNN